MIISLKEIILLPNLITLFRLLLSVPITIVFLNYSSITDSNYYILAIILIAFLSDLADGFFARRYNLVSETGKLLDPLADKLLTGIIIIFLWKLCIVPTLYMLLLIGRDLLIFCGGILLTIKIKKIIPSNYFGKLTVFTIGLYFITVLVFNKNNTTSIIFMYLSAIMSLLSIVIYLHRGLKIYRDHGSI